MDLSVIIRYSNRSKAREYNLNALLDLIVPKNNLEIILSVMEQNINIKHQRVRKIFTPNPFESSKANNRGAAVATTDIFVFQDADIIFDPLLYDGIVHQIRNGFETVRVAEQCINVVGSNDAARLVKKTFGEGAARRDAPGACVALSRKAFIRIGGHCELFKVYGWEDCYFRYKAAKLTKHHCLKGQMIHLGHEENYQAGKQPVNAGLFSELLSTDGGNCLRLAERDRIDLLSKYPGIAK